MTIDGGTLTVEPARHIENDVEFYDVPVELVVIDMMGPMVSATGAVEAAFVTASEDAGFVQSDDDRDRMLRRLRDTAGQSVIDVFGALTVDEAAALSAERSFDAAFRERLSAVSPVPGAELALRLLRESGVAVALTSRFSRYTTRAIVDRLGWRDIADAVLSSADAERGLPFPDMPLTALMRSGAQSVDGMIVVGDSVTQVQSGLAAGAGLVVGVLSGAHSAEELHQAGADEVLTSIEMLPAMLGVTPEE